MKDWVKMRVFRADELLPGMVINVRSDKTIAHTLSRAHFAFFLLIQSVHSGSYGTLVLKGAAFVSADNTIVRDVTVRVMHSAKSSIVITIPPWVKADHLTHAKTCLDYLRQENRLG